MGLSISLMDRIYTSKLHPFHWSSNRLRDGSFNLFKEQVTTPRLLLHKEAGVTLKETLD